MIPEFDKPAFWKELDDRTVELFLLDEDCCAKIFNAPKGSRFFGPDTLTEWHLPLGMCPRDGKLAETVRLLMRGLSAREVAAKTGRAKNTVVQTRMALEAVMGRDILCACGQSSRHSGFCAPRIARSPKRQSYLAQFGGR